MNGPEQPAIGRQTWVIVDGWIPPGSTGPAPEMTSHDTICILNPNPVPAKIEITAYFEDKEPVGPYRICVPGQRILHQRANDLTDPEPLPIGVDYSVLVSSDIPIVVQHTRLDSRQSENALATTIAYAGDA